MQVCPKISRPLCGLLVNFSVLMPRAFRSMRFELEWFEGKPSHLCLMVRAAVQAVKAH